MRVHGRVVGRQRALKVARGDEHGGAVAGERRVCGDADAAAVRLGRLGEVADRKKSVASALRGRLRRAERHVAGRGELRGAVARREAQAARRGARRDAAVAERCFDVPRPQDLGEEAPLFRRREGERVGAPRVLGRWGRGVRVAREGQAAVAVRFFRARVEERGRFLR